MHGRGWFPHGTGAMHGPDGPSMEGQGISSGDMVAVDEIMPGEYRMFLILLRHIYVGPHAGNDPFSRMVDHSREYIKIGQNRPFPRMDAFFWHSFWVMVASELFSIWAVRARPF
eukprot:2053798-Pleurochrysis_carterae.AAC.1